jgi:aprataxin
MSAAKKPKPAPTTPAVRKWKMLDFREDLGPYIEKPSQYYPAEVIDYDLNFVVIRDRYPKASVHLLLLPRDESIFRKHPLEALSTDMEFLEAVKCRVEDVKQLAARELRRLYGQYSVSDRPYQEAREALMTSDDPPPPEELEKRLPRGRNWLKEIRVGVHTHPSMNHMHIHIFSREMHSSWMKHKKHYLSFNSSFLVPLEDFPLPPNSERFHAGNWPSWDMKCWRCGRNFENRFAQLKAHLEEEFEEWKKE